MAAASLLGDALGERIEPALVHRRELGEAALAAQKALVAAPDAIARLQPHHVGPHRLDHARQIAADDERLGQFRGIHRPSGCRCRWD